MSRWSPVLLLMMFWHGPASSSTYEIDPAGGGDFATIQEAIDFAVNGDIIELTDGTFTGTGNVDLDFGGKQLIVRSQGGDPWNCIIDCDGSAGTPHRAFIFENGEDSNSRVENIAMIYGYQTSGGAVLVTDGGPVFSGCVFSRCQASSGGVVRAEGMLSFPRFEYCTFVDNRAASTGAIASVLSQAVLYVYDTTAYRNGSGGETLFQFSFDTSAHIERTIIAFNDCTAPVQSDPGAGLSVSCTDIHGNSGGDWIGSVAGLEGVSDNFSLDPLFCDAGGADFTLHSNSPCSATSGFSTCGQIGAWPDGCGPQGFVVDPSGAGDYPTIQAALDAAPPGETVELTDGTFTGDGNRDLSFGGKALTLRSISADATLCIIDCQGSAGDPHRGFVVEDGETQSTRVEDITIANGYATIRGGAILVTKGDATFERCIFRDCAALNGGVYGTENLGSTLHLYSCLMVDNIGSGGAVGSVIESASSVLFHCTIARNGDGSGPLILLQETSTLIQDTIIAFNDCTLPVWCILTYVAIECSDVFGNSGGDWVGCLEDLEGMGGNVSLDPHFCDPDADDFSLNVVSPCGAELSTCGRIGAFDVACSWALGDVTDVPNDQGRETYVSWDRFPYDAPGNPETITHYSLFRRIDPLSRCGDGAAGDHARDYPPGSWSYLLSVPAYGEDTYTVVAPTACDSTVSEGLCWSVFFVRAGTDDPFTYYDAVPDSGYSVDNLAPGIPTGLVLGDTDLSWDAATEEDFQHHSVYGSASMEFDPTATLIGYTIDPTYDVSAESYGFYHVTTTDHAGNEGEAASVEGALLSSPEITIPAAFALSNAGPNPFRAGTSLTIALPEAREVRLTIHDVSGRLVRSLVTGPYTAGFHPVIWDARDDGARRVGPGIYFAWIQAGEYEAVRRLTMIR